MRAILVPALLVLVAAGCDNSDSDGFQATTGTVQVQVYFDRDGTKSYTIFDTLYAGATVVVRATGNGPIIDTDVTDENGIVIFREVQLGRYVVEVDDATIGDSLEVVVKDTVNLVANDTIEVAAIRLSYPEWSIQQARNADSGTRVFLRGRLISMLQNFRDTTVHLSDTSGYIRLTRAGFAGSTLGNFPGDSVTVVATAGKRAGQPTGDLAWIVRLAVRPPPIPITLTSAKAASADTGTGVGSIDAALVQVSASITDTTHVPSYFKIVIDDGSGPLDVMADINFGVADTLFAPGKSINVTGVLVPTGTGKWILKARSVADLPPPL